MAPTAFARSGRSPILGGRRTFTSRSATDASLRSILKCTLPAPPRTTRDFLLGQVRDARARNSLIVNLEPSPAEGSELVGRFDIVLGETVLSRKP